MPAFDRAIEDVEYTAALDHWFAWLEQACPAWRETPLRARPSELRAALEASWERVLRIDLYLRRSHWQGCINELHADDVIDAVRLMPHHG